MGLFVAVTDSLATDDLSIERAVLADMRIALVDVGDPAGLAALGDADAVMCTHVRLDEETIGALRRCRIIARFGTGLDNIDRAAAERAGITVEGVADYCTPEVADHTMALLLCWNRRILDYHRFVADGRWNERPAANGEWGYDPPARLGDQTLGLLGFGHIGQTVAQRARAFGLTVIAHTRHAERRRAEADGLGVTLVGLDELLDRSDYLSLHVPLTDETRHVVDAGALARMKPGTVLINTARGDLVDDEALVEALRADRLGGALLDVYAHAPLPPVHALRELPNVVFSPHVAYYSDAVVPALRRLAAETVRRHLTGAVAVRSEP